MVQDAASCAKDEAAQPASASQRQRAADSGHLTSHFTHGTALLARCRMPTIESTSAPNHRPASTTFLYDIAVTSRLAAGGPICDHPACEPPRVQYRISFDHNHRLCIVPEHGMMWFACSWRTRQTEGLGWVRRACQR